MDDGESLEKLANLLYQHQHQKKNFSFMVDDYQIHCRFDQTPYCIQIVLQQFLHHTIAEKNTYIAGVIQQNTAVLGAFDGVLGYNKKNDTLFLQQRFAKVTHQVLLSGIEKALQHADILLQKIGEDETQNAIHTTTGS